MRPQTKNYKLKTKKGFSLFELMVVLSIAAVITVVTFSNFPKMNSKLALDLLAQDVALTFRQAQVYGTTVLGTDASTQEFESYGVSFPNPTNPLFVSGGEDYKYTIFADLSILNTSDPDRNMKGFYNEETTKCMEDGENCLDVTPCGPATKTLGGSEKECVQRYSITGKAKVKAICLNYLNKDNIGLLKEDRVTDCTGAQTYTKQPDQDTTVDVTYKRPKMQANFQTKKDGYECSNTDCASPTDKIKNVGIIIESESATEWRVVVVWANGQISVDR